MYCCYSQPRHYPKWTLPVPARPQWPSTLGLKITTFQHKCSDRQEEEEDNTKVRICHAKIDANNKDILKLRNILYIRVRQVRLPDCPRQVKLVWGGARNCPTALSPTWQVRFIIIILSQIYYNNV